jgi:hypothetical protein
LIRSEKLYASKEKKIQRTLYIIHFTEKTLWKNNRKSGG